MLTPLTLCGQVDAERLQELDKLMFNGRYFESKELYKNLSDTTTIPSDLDLFYKFRMAQFLNKTDSVFTIWRSIYLIIMRIVEIKC